MVIKKILICLILILTNRIMNDLLYHTPSMWVISLVFLGPYPLEIPSKNHNNNYAFFTFIIKLCAFFNFIFTKCSLKCLSGIILTSTTYQKESESHQKHCFLFLEKKEFPKMMYTKSFATTCHTPICSHHTTETHFETPKIKPHSFIYNKDSAAKYYWVTQINTLQM